jgi:Flp pilus assembly protein TadD
MNVSRLIRAVAAAALAFALAMSPAIAVDTGGDDTSVSAPAVPTLKEARADIAAKNWTAAIKKLSLIVEANPGSADAYNLLGYSFRNAGNNNRAMQAYNRALKLDPKHKGALEYQGILFVKLGDLDKAKANLAKLETICGTGCEEYEDLAEAIKG